MNTKLSKSVSTLRRKIRIRSKIEGSSQRPRLSVFRSNKYVTAQIIDDSKKVTLVSVSSKELGKIGKLGKNGLDKSKEVGLMLAKKAIAKKIKAVVFDKGSYRYHGKVKAVAEGAREGGLIL